MRRTSLRLRFGQLTLAPGAAEPSYRASRLPHSVEVSVKAVAVADRQFARSSRGTTAACCELAQEPTSVAVGNTEFAREDGAGHSLICSAVDGVDVACLF